MIFLSHLKRLNGDFSYVFYTTFNTALTSFYTLGLVGYLGTQLSKKKKHTMALLQNLLLLAAYIGSIRHELEPTTQDRTNSPPYMIRMGISNHSIKHKIYI